MNMLEAVQALKKGDDSVGDWPAQNPKEAIILLAFKAAAKGHKDKMLILEGMADLYSKASKNAGVKALKLLEEAAVQLGEECKDDVTGAVDTIIETHEPVDLFVARNELLLVPKFRAAVREALLDMGDRPAGDVTLEQIMAGALRLVMERAMRRKAPEPEEF